MKKVGLILFVTVCYSTVFCQTTVTFKPDATIGQDANIFMPNSNVNGGNDVVLIPEAWTVSGSPVLSRSLLKFDELATIPTSAIIISATLKLYGVPSSAHAQGNSCYPGTPSLYGNCCPNTVFIQKVTSAWDEQTVRWNTQPTTTTVNQITIPQTNLQWNWNFTDNSANLVAMVQDWVTNPATNFGFMFRMETEVHYRSLLFASSNHSTPALHPELIITYIDCQRDTTIFNATICEGDTYSANGFNQSKAGTYTHKFKNSADCDSLVILNLTVEECCKTEIITVKFKPDAAIGQDAIIWNTVTCVFSGQSQPVADVNFGNEGQINISAWTASAIGCPWSINRTLLKFAELSTIPTNAVIISAELKLYGAVLGTNSGNSCYPGSAYNSYCPNLAYIQKVASAWNEQTVTWNTQPTTTTVNQIIIPQSTSQWNWNFTDNSANLVTMVRDWVSNPATNFGVMMKLETEAYYRSLIFASSDHSNPALHPELIVTYEARTGKKDTTNINAAICEGKTYSDNNFKNLTQAGIYSDTLQNIDGCDSIIILTLDVMNKEITTLNAAICEGIFYTQNGFNDSDSGAYTQILQNRFGCDSIVILHLSVVKPPDTVFISAAICEGETYTKNGFSASKTGIYEQKLQNYAGCDSVTILDLTVNQTPDIEIVAVTDNFCEKDFIELEIITNGDSSIWNTGSRENIITITKSGTYTATAYLGDCKETASYFVDECPCIIFLQNSFTPNNDGINEIFKPYISCSETLKDYKMFIYNRWGGIVFKSFDYAVGWDGTTGNGKDCADGVYFCVIDFTTSKNKHVAKNGSITVFR